MPMNKPCICVPSNHVQIHSANKVTAFLFLLSVSYSLPLLADTEFWVDPENDVSFMPELLMTIISKMGNKRT